MTPIIKAKPAEQLDVSDLRAHPVWMFVGTDAAGETVVRAVKRLPVFDAQAKIIGTRVRLANGSEVWALLGNIDPSDPRKTEHFLTISVERDGRWFHLARYHDVDSERRGPQALAQFLGLEMDQVFPIAYDVRAWVSGGESASLSGVVRKDPRERLTETELVRMAIPRRID